MRGEGRVEAGGSTAPVPRGQRMVEDHLMTAQGLAILLLANTCTP